MSYIKTDSYPLYPPYNNSEMPLKVGEDSFTHRPHTHAYAMPEKELSGKAHFTNKEIGGINLLVSAIFFGILALMFPPASVTCGIYGGLSLSCILGGWILLTSGEKPVEVPSASEFSEF